MNVLDALRVSENLIPVVDNIPHRDDYLIFASSIFHTQRMRNLDRDEYVNYHSRFLKRLLGSTRYTSIISKMLHLNIIEIDDLYIVGKKSFGYRLKGLFRHNLVKPMVTDSDAIRRLTNISNEHRTATERLHRFTLKNMRKLSFDSTAARTDFEINTLPSREVAEDILCDLELWEQAGRKRMLYSLIGRNSGRNFTPFASLNSNLRNYMTLDGEDLAMIDIKNSQPYFAIVLYNEISNKTFINDVSQERERYTNDVISGIYEIINEGSFSDKGERGTFKKQFLTALYDKVLHSLNNPVWQKVKSRYPLLSKKMEDIKINGHYSDLAIRLQREESSIFVERILRYFANKEPDFFILGLHDGLMFVDTPENRNRIKAMVLECCKIRVGIEPAYTIETVRRNSTWTHRKKKRYQSEPCIGGTILEAIAS